jgi:prevent-host-death family protein
MKVNMLEAKNQLSRLVKDALASEDIVIASNGEPMVRLVPVFNSPTLSTAATRRWRARRRRLASA